MHRHRSNLLPDASGSSVCGPVSSSGAKCSTAAVFSANCPKLVICRGCWPVFGIVPISSTKAYWAGGVAAPKTGDRAPLKYKPDLLALFKDWPTPIKTIIEGTPLERINKVYVHDHNPMETWHRDNVLLIGGAAHAPLPTSGQGACQAIEDAWHLSNLLDNRDESIESVFHAFTKIRFPKTTSITMGARQFASSLFHTNEIESRIRNENSKNTDYDLVVNGMAKGWSSGLPIYA